MTTTLQAERPGVNGIKPSPRTGIAPAPRRQRSRPAAVVAGLCAVVGMAAFVAIWAASSDRQSVLAVARPVKAGDPITVDDLAVAALPEDPSLRPIPASERASVVGKTAATDLVAGSLIVEGQIGAATMVNPGEAVVAVEVSLAAAPVDSLHGGDRVQVVKTARSADAGEVLGEVVAEGRVLRVAAGNSSTGSSVVSVVVSKDRAAVVAGASVSQRAALVALAQGGR